MSVGASASFRITVLTVILAPLVQINPAHAGEGFLWLPFPIGTPTPGDCRHNCAATGVCIYCKWSRCVDGVAYDHQATDYGCTNNNTEVRAAADGEVAYTRGSIPSNTFPPGGAYGNIVKIRHDTGHETWYAHLLPNTITVRRGDRVMAGQLLGLSDNTGQSTASHLHFEVRDPQGRRVNPYGDPPDYTGGCGPNALWVTCPPTPAPPPDVDGDGFTVAQGDCNDTNRDVHPVATETCNGTDDDCDGTPDDPWRSGLAQDIGNPCTVGTGACANSGTWVCAPNGATTVCGIDPLPPRAESCNSSDDDCDGSTDENWHTGLSTDLDQPCSITWDACRGSTTGVWACTPDGLAVVCSAPSPSGTPAAPETCNGVDDDCNGTVDDLGLALLSDVEATRNHPSVAWDDERDQFSVVWAEYGTLSGVAGFHLRSRILDAIGNPIGTIQELTSESRSHTFGTDIAWDGSGYGIAWLANVLGDSEWTYELLFVRLDVDGATIGATAVIAGPWRYTGSASSFSPRVRIATRSDGFTIAAYTQNASASIVGAVISNVMLLHTEPTGALVGAPISVLENPDPTSVRSEQFTLSVVDDQDVVAWSQGSSTGSISPDLMVGAWSGPEARRATVAPRFSGWRFGLGIACIDASSCHLLSFMSFLGSNWGVVHDFNAEDMVVAATRGVTVPGEWGAPTVAAVSCGGALCSIAATPAYDAGSSNIVITSVRVEDGVMTFHRRVSDAAPLRAVTIHRGRNPGVAVWSTTDELYATSWCTTSE